jgi:hypothetical protein
MRDFDSIEKDWIEKAIDKVFEDMKRAHGELDAARRTGKNIISVACDPSTKRGDIIDVAPLGENGEISEAAEIEKKARVVATHEMVGINPDTHEISCFLEAICILLEDGDITTEEDFATLYAEGEKPQEEDIEEIAEAESEDPNICSCGANRQMCERNQNVFGGHLNE